MGERSDQITRKIEQTRGELRANLNELEHKVRDVTDWRKQVQKSPLTMIGIAFGGGVLLSRVLGGGSQAAAITARATPGLTGRQAPPQTPPELTTRSIRRLILGTILRERSLESSQARSRTSFETPSLDFTRNIRRPSTRTARKVYANRDRAHPGRRLRVGHDEDQGFRHASTTCCGVVSFAKPLRAGF